jgi:hypothetical protein
MTIELTGVSMNVPLHSFVRIRFAEHGPVRDATLGEFATEWAEGVAGDRDDTYADTAMTMARNDFRAAYLGLVRIASRQAS